MTFWFREKQIVIEKALERRCGELFSEVSCQS